MGVGHRLGREEPRDATRERRGVRDSKRATPRCYLREMGGAPRSPAPRNHLRGVDCQTIRLPLHGWALDKQSLHRGSKIIVIVQCRSHSGALPLSPKYITIIIIIIIIIMIIITINDDNNNSNNDNNNNMYD